LKIGKEIPIFIKTAPFCTLKKKQEKGQESGDASPGTVHCLPRRAARVADFQACLLPRLAPNPTKHAPTCPPGTHLSWGVVRSGQKGLEQLRFLAQIVHLGQSANLAVRGAHFEPTV
jgi:hypothetical protein